MFLAPVIALLPFLLNLGYWREHGIWRGLVATIVAGIAIGLTIAVFFFSFYAALTWIAVRTGKFRQPPIVVQILLGSFAALTGVWWVSLLRQWKTGEPYPDMPFLPVLVFSGLIATAFSLFFSYQRAKEDSLASRAEAAEARYHVLENQMRPHFLFNALNSLAELIESGREDAAETTYKLSNLYRRILDNSGLKTATLASELDIVRDYLELEQLRFGARLRFEIRAPENCEEIFLPSLMLQTLVENAVKHGIASSVEGGKVSVEVSPMEIGYFAEVINSSELPISSVVSGTGLSNTKSRLDLLYGNLHGFKLISNPGLTVVSFVFSGQKIG